MNTLVTSSFVAVRPVDFLFSFIAKENKAKNKLWALCASVVKTVFLELLFMGGG